MYTLELDENLIIRMAAGDRDAFRDLYLQTSGAVFGYALSILRNRHDAENVMHDTFLRTFRSAGSYRAKGKPLAWILIITRNLCYDLLRSGIICEDLSQYGNAALSGGTAHSVPPSALDPSEAVLDRVILGQALQVLDFEDRQIVMLHALTGMKHREIAELLDLPTGTVLSRYNRALKKMRTMIGEKRETR